MNECCDGCNGCGWTLESAQTRRAEWRGPTASLPGERSMIAERARKEKERAQGRTLDHTSPDVW